ncbi:MAG: ATP-dependent Clp protease adapter ClpS [Oligoflexales bacterium]|nr:ATP-dependent Clp protease adapter ClpS [Oligoflexales bacterium]
MSEILKSSDIYLSRSPKEDNEGFLSPSHERKVRIPSKFKVILHNDDYTPMDFVVEILEKIFRKDASIATRIMLDVHQKGRGICGTYPYDIAETKVILVTENARTQNYPLKCTMEEE